MWHQVADLRAPRSLGTIDDGGGGQAPSGEMAALTSTPQERSASTLDPFPRDILNRGGLTQRR